MTDVKKEIFNEGFADWNQFLDFNNEQTIKYDNNKGDEYED